MEPTTLIFAVAAVTAGAVVRGYSGFGSSLLWVSSLSLVLPPAKVVPTVFMLEILASARLLPKVWTLADWRSLRWLLLGTVLGTPPGIFLLATLPAAPVRVAISLVVLSATVLIWRGFTLQAIPGPGPTVLTGLACGLSNGWTGIGGPPAILFYFSSPAAVAVSRASLIAFFLVLDALGLAMATTQDLVTSEVLLLAGLLAGPVLIGIALGNRRFLRTEPETFRRFVLVLLAALSLAVFLRAILG
ncbi:MAG: sulfite exporter TauE/SafE family protein [Kiloniellaceae bacterium]